MAQDMVHLNKCPTTLKKKENSSWVLEYKANVNDILLVDDAVEFYVRADFLFSGSVNC